MAKAHFDHIESEILKAINDAKSSLKIAVAWFVNKNLFKALLESLGRGVKVEIVILNDLLNNRSGGLKFQRLIDSNAGFYFSKGNKLMHNKFCIIDGIKVFTGSYNWTYAAEKNNNENLAENFPLPERFANIDWLHSHVDLLDHLFTYSKDSQVKQYYARMPVPIDTSNLLPPLHADTDLKINYVKRRIKWIFDYDLHIDIPGMQIIECSFSTVKPGERVALPSYLFLKYENPLGLTFKISSNEKATVVGNVII